MSALQEITPSVHDLGAFKVRRVLPSRPRTMVGPFIFVDEFGPAQMASGQGMDVRPHPHINLATVTYLFEGAIHHRDSLGTSQVIRPGAINLMTAGKGIVHSERSPQAERDAGPRLYGMQTWLALPDGREEIAPAFDHVTEEGLPLVEDGKASARVLMGTLWGQTATTPQHSPTIYADIVLEDGALPIDAEADERAVLVTEGTITLDDQPLDPFNLYILKPGEPMTLKGRGRAMLLGGEAFSTKRHVWWNFVSSSRDRIAQAKEDWTARRFPLVPGDDVERIPIPAVPKTVSYP
ncbi:pirin family protein [Sphingomicrobium astaxanthinifaciens]|uniref:pirin family protein n=1 Tax=Sphingomicrobium astaxanthinifaciens TaxID=1227949 RepID=UPI001FCB2EB2|nr:pirin family protein [Sphingomicrobium astaxanthinifaciens]MCJ7421382.1 pirin family protein [Sphingomicrobium astaxanthinifaciens]